VIVYAVAGGGRRRRHRDEFRNSTVIPAPRSSPRTLRFGSLLIPSDRQVRGVEIGIVLLVLLVWVAAIVLFFNRWGKIRMLLPYQPDYKQEQLKVPGTAACAAAVASGNTCTHHSGDHLCQQPCPPQPPRKHRPRINSAIFVSNSGPGLDPKEFFRRHGSVSRLCRKARSVDNISLEENHFGLPTLSVSGPSPPEDEDRDDIEEETQRFLE
jgi:hypothetical protein